MDHQTTVNGEAHEVPSRTLARNAAGIAHELVGMAELQGELLAADFRQIVRDAIRGLSFWVVAGLLAFATLPVALAGAGLWLAEGLDQRPAAGLLWVSLAAALLAAGAGMAGWLQFRMQAMTLERSRRELRENIMLLKQILTEQSAREAAERAASRE